MKSDLCITSSIIIPVYNGEAYLQEAIDSCLNQKDSNAEILVVDDGSSDKTHEILAEYQTCPEVRALQHPGRVNLGVSKSRGLGVCHARGKYIAFLDADDTFLPEKMATQIKILEDNPDVVLCHSGIYLQSELPDAPDRESYFQLAPQKYKYDYREEPYFLVKNRICNSTAVLRSSAIVGIDFAVDQLFQFEDWLLWVLMATKGKFFFCPEKLTTYRYHANSATARIDQRPLMGLYSKMEFLLCLMAKYADSPFRSMIAEEFYDIFSKLFRHYMGVQPQDPLPDSISLLLREIGLSNP
jgi:glycosyltransferase involved in cell wall biosynthesis